jgi:hypothetical protein
MHVRPAHYTLQPLHGTFNSPYTLHEHATLSTASHAKKPYNLRFFPRLYWWHSTATNTRCHSSTRQSLAAPPKQVGMAEPPKHLNHLNYGCPKHMKQPPIITVPQDSNSTHAVASSQGSTGTRREILRVGRDPSPWHGSYSHILPSNYHLEQQLSPKTERII